MDIAFEDVIPSLVQYLKPELGRAPKGHEQVREAFQNTALSYDDRVELLREGEEEMREDAEAIQNWRIGQGLTAGAIAAGAGVRGLSMVNDLANALDTSRSSSKVGLLEQAVARAQQEKGDILDIIAGDAARGAGLSPVKDMSVRDLLRGPLQSQYGNQERALRELGQYSKTRMAQAGLTEFNDPIVSKALRAITAPERSLWDQISRKAARGLRSVGSLGSNPLARLGITGVALGTGAYLGGKSVDEDKLPDHSEEEALELLQRRDRAMALARMPGLPSPERVENLPRGVSKIPQTLAAIDGRKIEEAIGGSVRNADAYAHMQNPQVGANWMTL